MLQQLVPAAVDLCRAVAPEIRDLPGPYILTVTELWGDAEPERANDCYGWTTHRQDLLHRDYLRSKGRWQGRGPAFVMNDRLLTADDYGDTLPAHFLGISLHEFGHVLHEYLDEIRGTDENTVPMESLQAQADWIATVQTKVYSPEAHAWVRRRHHHPETWGRVALHLAHRGRQALGWSKRQLPTCLVWRHPEVYHAGVWEEALGSEPADLANLTIAEILERPLPARYMTLCDEFNNQPVTCFSTEDV